VTHFIIHAYDFAPLADRGIAAAPGVYGGIAPAVAARRATCPRTSIRWSVYGRKSIASNASALENPARLFTTRRISRFYAHLQLAQDVKAKAMIEKVARHGGSRRSAHQLRQFHRQGCDAGPAYVLGFGVIGAGAAALPMVPSQYPMADSLFPASPAGPRHGAHRQSRRRGKAEDRGHEGTGARRWERVNDLLLGRPHGRADARRLRLDRVQGGERATKL